MPKTPAYELGNTLRTVLRTQTAVATLLLCVGITSPAIAQEHDLGAFVVSEAGMDAEIPDILSCPFDQLLAAYEGIYTDAEQIAYAAVFNEVTKICTERQRKVQEILNQEQKLRTLLADMMAPKQVAEFDANLLGQCPPVAEFVDRTTEPPAPLPDDEDLKEAKAEELAVAQNMASGPLSCADPYQLTAILGSSALGTDLHAVIYDTGTGDQLTVRKGDVLPGGIMIAAVSRDGVVIEAGGEQKPLLKRPAKAEISDGGGLIVETATVEDLYNQVQADPVQPDGENITP